ncbi:MAG: iron-containing redox enzyme family protein [Candidatus Thermoplasmatota archaeon]|nr:iron-containing redox enzyme family protein [Candidatus Thermoplasmatota archaeon]
MKCAVCGHVRAGGYQELARHFYDLAEESDPSHVMWLNRNITRRKIDVEALAERLRKYDEGGGSLATWIKQTFIERFLGEKPHPFVLALQNPSRAVLLGYVLEHQHFLRQWVRSCASVIAKTDKVDVTLYEIDNIATEFGGQGRRNPSHYELLIRMGEALGLERGAILSEAALPKTREAISTWRRMAKEAHWLEIMAAMHSLELIANRRLRDEGAAIGYFDPRIFSRDDIPQAVKDFLREGYEADVRHSEEALALVEKYTEELGMEEQVRSAVLESMDAFDTYLQSRLERSREYEGA